MNCPHCNQPIDAKLIAQALAKRNSGPGSRPGSTDNRRNPYGRKGKRCPTCGYTKEDAQIHMDHHLCKNAGNAPWEL